jgi:hypothetical protein
MIFTLFLYLFPLVSVFFAGPKCFLLSVTRKSSKLELPDFEKKREERRLDDVAREAAPPRIGELFLQSWRLAGSGPNKIVQLEHMVDNQISKNFGADNSEVLNLLYLQHLSLRTFGCVCLWTVILTSIFPNEGMTSPC